jgi:hypothetical protein
MPDLTGPKGPEQRNDTQKHYDQMVLLAMKTVASKSSCNNAQIHTYLFYGDTAADPCNLTAWYIFKKDSCVAEAKRNGLAHRMIGLTRKELIRNGYPVKAVAKIKISFTSDEDIQNKTDGNYWRYFQ